MHDWGHQMQLLLEKKKAQTREAEIEKHLNV